MMRTKKKQKRTTIKMIYTSRSNLKGTSKGLQLLQFLTLFLGGIFCMRLWHYKLIPVLPRQQLLGQWRECCAIAKLIANNKTPGHPLVNKITGYPAWMFYVYQFDLEKEFKKRGYLIHQATRQAIYDNCTMAEENGYFADDDDFDFMMYMNDPFPGWHNDRYLIQCYFNLEEKYDCGMISEKEWTEIEKRVQSLNIFI